MHFKLIIICVLYHFMHVTSHLLCCRWCRLLRVGKVTKVVAVVLDSLSTEEFNKYPESLPTLHQAFDLVIYTFVYECSLINLFLNSFIHPQGPLNVLCYGACHCQSVRLSVRPALAKFCLLINFKLISLRLTFLSIMNGHDPQMIPFDLGVSRSEVKATVTLNIKSLFA